MPLLPKFLRRRSVALFVCLVISALLVLPAEQVLAAGYTLTIPQGSSKVYISINGQVWNSPLNIRFNGTDFACMNLADFFRYKITLPQDGFKLVYRYPISFPEREDSTSQNNKPENAEPQVAVSKEERQMLGLVNKERIAAGLSPLEFDMRLVQIARRKSQDMIDKNTLLTPPQRMARRSI